MKQRAKTTTAAPAQPNVHLRQFINQEPLESTATVPTLQDRIKEFLAPNIHQQFLNQDGLSKLKALEKQKSRKVKKGLKTKQAIENLTDIPQKTALVQNLTTNKSEEKSWIHIKEDLEHSATMWTILENTSQKKTESPIDGVRTELEKLKNLMENLAL